MTVSFPCRRLWLAAAVTLAIALPASAQTSTSITALPTGVAATGTEWAPVSQQNPSTGVYSTVKLQASQLSAYILGNMLTLAHTWTGPQTFAVAPQYTATTGFGNSVVNPGTGFLEDVLPVQTVAGASKAYLTADLFKKTRRSNSGSAMTDTFPSSTATGMVNGTRIVLSNADATASITITAGSGTSMPSGSTDVIGPGRDVAYEYDATAATWRGAYNTRTALLAAPGTGLAISGGNLNLQPAAPSTIGGVESDTSAAHNWIAYIDSSGVPHQSQPNFSDLSSSAACSQLPALTGDVGTSAGSCAATIQPNVVGYSDQAQAAANTLSGNPTGALANKQDIALPSCPAGALNWTTGSPGTIGCNTGWAPLASPALTGAPTAPTQTAGDNSTKLATDAFVQNAVAASGVSSFNGRTGAVTPTAGDYTAAKIGSTGAYYRTKIVSFCASGCTFTSGPYTPDTGLVYDDITCVGGGGAGGGAVGSASAMRGGGGGSAGVVSRVMASAASIGASQTVTLGAAGAGSSGATGGNGGTTSLGSICSANGGNGGVLYDGSTGFGAGGTSPTTGTGDVVSPGQAGGVGLGATITTVGTTSGFGGNSPYGAGGVQGNGSAAGANAVGYGSAGGGGNEAANASNAAGGNGTPGKIVIVEYLNQ